MIDYLAFAFTSGAVRFAYATAMFLISNAVLYKGILWLNESSREDYEWLPMYIASVCLLVFINIIATSVILNALGKFISHL